MVTLLVESEELRIHWHDLVHKGGGRDSRVSCWEGLHYVLHYLRVSVILYPHRVSVPVVGFSVVLRGLGEAEAQQVEVVMSAVVVEHQVLEETTRVPICKLYSSLAQTAKNEVEGRLGLWLPPLALPRWLPASGGHCLLSLVLNGCV